MKTILIILAVMAAGNFFAGAEGTSAGTYGGWSGLRSRASGFFRTEKIGDRWWLITPDGFAYYAIATDHVNYRVHWCQKLGYAPYNRNVEKKYKGDETAWAAETVRRLKSWNFNSLGANNSESVRNRELAYMEFLAMGSDFAGKDSIVERVHWTGFPNVYNPEFTDFCEKRAKERCAPRKDDPWLLGYFIDNELEWYGKDGSDVGVANEAITRDAKHSGKKALIELLKKRYSTIQAFNKAWGTQFASWENAAEETTWNEKNTNAVLADKTAYVRDCCERYFAVTTSAIRKADPNHLILGCRFAMRAPGIWDIAGKYCDIVTFNYYGPVDLEARKPVGLLEDLEKWAAETKKPMMVTEWSFPALDAGLPSVHGAGMRVRTQREKAIAYSIYQTAFFQLPFMVGSSYFMWVDEPALGIHEYFPEDSNYGLVDVNDEPWKELTETAARVNAQVYPIHSRQIPVLKISAGPVLDPNTGSLRLSVTNVGEVPANKAEVLVIMDGRRVRHQFSIKEGETRKLEIPVQAKAGAHDIAVQLDPDRKLVQTSLGDYGPHQALLYRQDKRRKGTVLAVANRSKSAVKGAAFIVPLKKLFDGARTIAPFVLKDEKGLVSFEVLDADRNGTLSVGDDLVVALDIPAGAAKTLYAVPAASLPVGSFIQSRKVDRYEISTGLLNIKKNTANGSAVDTVQYGSLDLGLFVFMICQKTPRSFWIPPERLVDIRLFEGNHMRRVEITSEHRAAPGAEDKPFRLTGILDILPGKRWFSARYASVTNTGSEPWILDSYFYCPYSAIGGNNEKDEAGRTGNSRIGAWVDEDSNGIFGVAGLPESKLHCIFWKDTTQHADAYRRIEKMLRPNETWYYQDSPVLVFGGRADQKPNPWEVLEQEIRELPVWSVFR